MHNFIENAAKKIIISTDKIMPDGGLIKDFYTKNERIISSIAPGTVIEPNKFFNCKTRVLETLDASKLNGIILPLIPFEISPNDIYNDLSNISDFLQFQEKLINFLSKNYDKIKNNNPVSFNNINILNYVKAHSFFSNAVFADDFEYTSSFISDTLANERVVKFLNYFSEYMNINDDLKKETDVFAKLRQFYKIKIQEAVDRKVIELEKDKTFSLEQAKQENMPFIEGEIINHYNSKIKSIKTTNYSRFIDFFDSYFELLKFWPTWLDVPEFIDRNQMYDSYRYKLFTCLKMLDANVSLSVTPDRLVKAAYTMKLELLSTHKDKVLKEIDEILFSDNSIEELKALKDVLTSVNLQKLMDDHLGQYDDSTNGTTFFEIINFWPDILQPEPSILEELRSVLSSNNDVIYLP